MGKKEQINEIKRIIGIWGTTTSGERELGSSPCINSIGDNIVQLAEKFTLHDVDAVTYHNGNEIDTDYISYENLSENVIGEIYNIMLVYEIDMEKTMDRI